MRLQRNQAGGFYVNHFVDRAGDKGQDGGQGSLLRGGDGLHPDLPL